MSLQHLILGILKYGSMSGYDLNKTFQVSVHHFWDTDQSLIYRALYKMHDQGWVEAEVIAQEDLPAKKLYRLTDTGWAELRRWLAAPQPVPSLHEGWLGQLFFATELSLEQRRNLLVARRTEIEAILYRYEHDVPEAAAHYADLFNAANDAAFWLLTLQYGIEKMRFDLEWIERTLMQMDQLAGDSQQPGSDS